jgi:site-specific recombinase XerD
VPERNLWQRMRNYVDELGFPAGLDLHSFRRAYATNLQVEYGYDVSFVQLQLGHEHASTTSIYTLAAPDYRARELERVLTATLARSNARLGGPTPKES